MMFFTPKFIRIFAQATPACADAEQHDLQVLGPLLDDLQAVDEAGEDDDGGAVLVVVEDRDVESRP